MRIFNFNTIYRYIGIEFLFSFIVSFLFFFFIFFINQFLLMAEEVISRHVSFYNTILLIIYALPAILMLTIPFAVLTGTLMSLGRLASDNELLALQSSGIPLFTIFKPLFILAIIFTTLTFFMGDYFLPVGTIRFGKLYREILYANPELELQSYSVNRYQDSVLITGKVEEKIIHSLIIFDTTARNDQRVIFAKTAELTESEAQAGVITLSLEDVFGHITSRNKIGEIEYFSSTNMIYNILLKDITFSMISLTPREMSSRDVHAEIESMRSALYRRKDVHKQNTLKKEYDLISHYYYTTAKNQIDTLYNEWKQLTNREITDRTLQIYTLEFHKKIAIPFGCLAFVIFAFPIGLSAKKGGRTLGFGISLLVLVLYWAMLLAGQTIGLRSNFSPVLSMWGPNIIIIALGFAILLVKIKK